MQERRTLEEEVCATLQEPENLPGQRLALEVVYNLGLQGVRIALTAHYGMPTTQKGVKQPMSFEFDPDSGALLIWIRQGEIVETLLIWRSLPSVLTCSRRDRETGERHGSQVLLRSSQRSSLVGEEPSRCRIIWIIMIWGLVNPT